LQSDIEAFSGLCQLISENLEEWAEYSASESEDYFNDIPCELNTKLTNF